MAFGPAIRVPADASAALWIAPTLGSFETVGGLVPHGYECYLLLDHGVDEHAGWDGVCRLFERLAPLLARRTSTPDRCWFAIWEGYGFETSTTVYATRPWDDQERPEIERELVAQGAHPKAIQDRLRHSTIQLNHYGHPFPTRDRCRGRGWSACISELLEGGPIPAALSAVASMAETGGRSRRTR